MLILTMVLARLFGSSGYGEFVQMTTYVSFFYLLADFGFNAIYIQLQQSEKRQIWPVLLVTRLVVGALLCLVAFVILSVIPTSQASGYSNVVRIGILILIPTIFFQSMITTANGLFQKLLRYEWSMVSVTIGALCTVASLALLMSSGSNSLLLYSVIPLCIGSAATAASSFFFVKKSHIPFDHITDKTVFRKFFFATLPLGITLVFNVVYFHIDSIILTFFRSTSEVGIYGFAYKVFELALVIPTFFMNAIYPEMVKKDTSALHTFSKKVAISLGGMSLVLLFIVWNAAPLFVYIRQDFFPSISALRILSLGFPLYFLSSLTMWILITQKKQWKLAGIYAGSMCVNILLNFLFVPQYGYIAAAWITVIGEAIVLLASGAAVLYTKKL